MKNVKGKILGRKVLSFILTATLVLGLMPGNILTVSAEGTDTVISDELIVESVSSNDATSTTECTCGTDDPAFHATNCPAYIAPENPQCTCAEKCTDDTLNVWCDVCGVQGVSACQGEDTAVAYEIVASGTCGADGNESSVTWSLDNEGTLTISGTGAMADYELVVDDYPYHYTTPWHNTDNDGEYQNSNIKKVVVEEGVTHIGSSAFKDFTELTSISIPNTVKSIGYSSISYCEKLTSLVIPDSVTSIGEEAFYQNMMLTSVTIGNSVESIGGHAFYRVGCTAGTNFTITLPKSVTSIAPSAFTSIYKGATIRYSCSYNEGNGYSTENNTFNATLKQYHLYEYRGSGNKINCSGCTCGKYSSSTATLSLSSDEPIYYTGEEIKPAVTITYPDGWGGDKIEPNESNCTYLGNINAGTATCTFKYAEGVESSLDFTIEKADSVITAAPTPADLVYDGTALNLINAGTTTDGEMQYSLNGTNYSRTIPTGTDAKTYTVWYKVVGDKNHNDTTPASIEVTIAKAEITSITDFGVVAPVAGETPQSSVAAGTGYTAEISWQPDDTSYAPNTVYTATVTLTADTNYFFADSITVSGWDKSVDADKLVFTKEFDATGKLECDVIVPTANILTYNGSAQELVTAGTVPDGCEMQYKLGDDGTFSAEIPTATDANTYKVYWKVVGNDTYNDIDNGDYVEVTISKATPTAEMFTATPSSELVYDGTEKSIIVTTDKEGMGTFTVSYNPSQPVEAGFYIIRLHIEEGDNYNAFDTLSFGWFEIKKADSVISAAPTPIADLVYDGTAYYLINAGTATGGEMLYSLEEDGEYSTSIPQGLNAGDYTVWYKVVGDKNHNDTTPASIEVTIAPKTLEIGCVTARDRAFDGTNKVEVSEVIISGILNTDNVSVSATATIDSINVGEYSTVDLSGITLTGDAASNYSIVASAEDVDLVPTVTISKAAAPTLSRGSKAYVYNQSYEGEFVSITGLPTDCGEVEYVLLSVSRGMLEIVSIDANGKITYNVKALDSYTEDLQGTIDVNVEMENYETAFYKLTITRRDKYAVTVKDGMSVSLETNELIYGQRLGELAFNEVIFVGEAGEVVDGTLGWENSNEVPVVATDKASWRFIPESDVYKEVVGTLDITVKQAPLVVEAVPVVADRVYNPSVKLADVALSGGTVKDAYGHTIEGTWSWEDSGTVPTVGNAGYEAVFTPADANYETVIGTITVTVAKATPVIGTVSVLDAELENTTDISTVVLKRTDESMAGTLELTAEALLYGAHGYVWKFTPQDLNNYEVLTGTVAIEVKDTVAPVASYKIGTGDWETFGTSTTYETFSKERLSVEIKAEDSGSGIASVQYYVAPGEIPDVSYISGWTDYTEAITLDIDRTYVIYVKVTDNGGNEVILNSEGIVVYAESVITPTSFSCEYGEENNLYVNITTNGNTFANLTDGSGNEIATENYSIDGSTLTIKGEYLSDLDVGEYTYKICMNPQGVENTEVTLAYSFVVNVVPKELTVTGATATSRAYIANDKTVNITGITLSGIQGTDDVSVNLTGVKGTLSSDNAGTYTSLTLPELTLTGADKGNYELVQPTGPMTVWVSIEKLNAKIIVEYSEHGKIFGDPPFSLGVSDNNPEAEVTYESNNEDVATVTSEGIVTIHKAGAAQITVSLAESTNYLSADSKQIFVDVAKKDGYTVDTIQRNYLYSRENADTIDLSAYLPADCGEVTYGTPAVREGRIFSVAPTMNGSVLGYSVAVGEVSAAAQITVTVKSDNYADFTITVEPVLVEWLPVSPKTEVTLTNDTITYGDALSEMSFEEVVFEDEAGNAVAGTLAWKEAALKPEAGTTNATWVFTPDNEEYAVKEGSVAIVVKKATPVVVVPTVAERVYNPSAVLADSDLSGGSATGVDGNDLNGSWSWKVSGTVPVVNNSGYEAVFTPADINNYETVTETIRVKVNQATPVIAQVNGTTITYGDSLAASTVSGQAKHSDSVDMAVAGSFSWKDTTVKPAVADSDTTAFEVVFTPADSVNYKAVETTAKITVNKAPVAPNKPESSLSVPYTTGTVGETDLPAGWTWQNGETALEVGVVCNAVAVYTGTDAGNYETESVTVAITRAACVHDGETELRDEAEESCTEDGYTGDTYCLICEEKLATGEAIPATGHKDADKNHVCDNGCNVAQGTCEDTDKDHACDYGCDKAFGTHEAASGKHTCEYCGKAATSCKDDNHDHVCDICGEELEHSFLTEWKYDEDGHWHVCSCGLKKDEATHSFTSQVTKQPTVHAEGERTYTCGVCGDSYTEPITKIEPEPTPTPSATPAPTPTVAPTEAPATAPTQKPALPVATLAPIDPGKPFIQDDTGKIGWEVIRGETGKAKEGETIIVDMNGATSVPGAVFDDIKGKNITITLDMGTGVSWTINGKDITASKVNDINFEVKVGTKDNPINTIPVEVINRVTGERTFVNISLTHDGELGLKAILNINLDKKNAGLFANLFYYDESNKTIQFICADDVDENGIAHMAFTHASEYIIVLDKAIMNNYVFCEQAPATGDDSNVVWAMILMILSLSVAVGAVAAGKKRYNS